MNKKKPKPKPTKLRPKVAKTKGAAKPKPKPKPTTKPVEPMSAHYQYITASVVDGQLTMEYCLQGRDVPGRMMHDEDVSDFSRAEIEALVRRVLDVEESDPVSIVLDF